MSERNFTKIDLFIDDDDDPLILQETSTLVDRKTTKHDKSDKLDKSDKPDKSDKLEKSDKIITGISKVKKPVKPNIKTIKHSPILSKSKKVLKFNKGFV